MVVAVVFVMMQLLGLSLKADMSCFSASNRHERDDDVSDSPAYTEADMSVTLQSAATCQSYM